VSAPASTGRTLTALLVCPNRELGRQLLSVPAANRVQVLAELHTYPAPKVLDMRLRQIDPDLVILDVASDPAKAAQLIPGITGSSTAPILALHLENDAGAIVRALRMGASEFLAAPFDLEATRLALERVARLRLPRSADERPSGKVILFSSLKPGSGATFLACHTALQLRDTTGQPVLVMDLDSEEATATFCLGSGEGSPKPNPLPYGCESFQTAFGVDIRPAPEPASPHPDAVPHLSEKIDLARRRYGWVVLDAPAVFHRISLLALPEADTAVLVTTDGLTDLHLARKGIAMLAALGIGQERVRVAVNRRVQPTTAGLDKALGCQVSYSFPQDDAAERAFSQGRPGYAGSHLSRRIASLVSSLSEKRNVPKEGKDTSSGGNRCVQH
jgi:pilus assembly protein CpaE